MSQDVFKSPNDYLFYFPSKDGDLIIVARANTIVGRWVIKLVPSLCQCL